ncbi:MAG: 3-keto-5-aminohexanoate cleavage protein [Anaerolineales bacterium]|nr:3-keto-5-aminohexanoate cleavage protein [Anaerolineales bacterium]
MARPTIITCAITGSSHTPSMSPHLPVTPDEIVRQAVDAARAGAAIVHLHARNPQDGSPSADPGLFREYASRIKADCDAVISLTSGGATGQTVEQRLNVIRALKPELCTCNLGTLNYGMFPMIPKYAGQWQHAWEEPFLESTRREPFVSNFSDVEYMLTVLAAEAGVRFEFEAYDVGHLYTLAYFMDRGLIQPPVFLQFVLGTLGGIGAEAVDNLVFMKRTLDRLAGPDVQWSVLGGGRYQFNTVTAGALMGSHVRVGLEDSLYLGKGELAPSNAAQVAKLRGILEALSLEIAAPAQARQLLGLKGLANVGF